MRDVDGRPDAEGCRTTVAANSSNREDRPLAEAEQQAATQPIDVFIHLARNKDARAWGRAWSAGELVGLNEQTPYGYGRAERMGCRVKFSRSEPENLIGKALRLAVRVITGFDWIHAHRNRQAMKDADIIWTHTESQYLAVAATLMTSGATTKIIGQTVWLLDRWSALGPLHRAFYRKLIERVDVLTFHSELNLQRAGREFPGRSVELVRFGVPSEQRIAPRLRKAAPLRILSLGNDRDRDWLTLIAAVRDVADMRLVVLSGSAPKRLARGLSNVHIGAARTQAELLRNFDEATVVCVPLRSNLHASGVTVIQEAVLAGVPVVASEAGGLDAYFSRDQICYVPPGDVEALRDALLAVAKDPEAARDRARRAQAAMTAGGLGAEAYINQHVAISRRILNR